MSFFINYEKLSSKVEITFAIPVTRKEIWQFSKTRVKSFFRFYALCKRNILNKMQNSINNYRKAFKHKDSQMFDLKLNTYG